MSQWPPSNLHRSPESRLNSHEPPPAPRPLLTPPAWPRQASESVTPARLRTARPGRPPASGRAAPRREPTAGDVASGGPLGGGPPRWALRCPPHDTPTSRLDRPSQAFHPVRPPSPRLRHRLPQTTRVRWILFPKHFQETKPFLSGTKKDTTGRCLLAARHPPLPACREQHPAARGGAAHPLSSTRCGGGGGTPLPPPGQGEWPRQTLPESVLGLWPQRLGEVLSVPLGLELRTMRDRGSPRGQPGLRPLCVHTLWAHTS